MPGSARRTGLATSMRWRRWKHCAKNCGDASRRLLRGRHGRGLLPRTVPFRPTSILRPMATTLPTNLGALRTSEYTPERVGRSVKDELRDNLIAKLRTQSAIKGASAAD